MRRIILMAIMLTAVATAGCDRFSDLTIQVTANLEPSDTCTVTADQENVLLVGRYDLAAPEFDYLMATRVESYIVDNSTELQAPQGNMQITSFDITVKLPDGTVPAFGDGLPNPYNQRTSAVIPPSDAVGGVSSAVAATIALPRTYRTAVIDAVNAAGFNSFVLDVQANGETAGGFSQQSPAFSWPVELCNGCLSNICQAETDGTITGQGCLPGQDLSLWCATILPPDTASESN
jgi:hypothetical protein